MTAAAPERWTIWEKGAVRPSVLSTMADFTDTLGLRTFTVNTLAVTPAAVFFS